MAEVDYQRHFSGARFLGLPEGVTACSSTFPMSASTRSPITCPHVGERRPGMWRRGAVAQTHGASSWLQML
jgi:hypothetical protein